MHELDIAKRIAGAVIKTARESNFKKVNLIKLKIGKTQAVDPNQLMYFLKEQDPMMSGTKIESEEIDVSLKCKTCGKEFGDERFNDHDFAHTYAHAPKMYVPPVCTDCKSTLVNMIHGEELEIVSINGD